MIKDAINNNLFFQKENTIKDIIKEKNESKTQQNNINKEEVDNIEKHIRMNFMRLKIILIK